MAQANLEYFLAWIQSLQLPSTQPESPPTPKPHESSKVRNVNGIYNFSFLDRDYSTSRVTVTEYQSINQSINGLLNMKNSVA
jgi:hypothetical protein